MIRQKLAFVVLILFLFSCSGRKRIPSGVLEPVKMEKVLYDVVLAEGYAESYLYMDSSRTRKEWMDGELEKVLAIHKVSAETFQNSFAFYKKKTRPAETDH